MFTLANVDEEVDGVLEEIGFVHDPQTTWWEVTDALFIAGFYSSSHVGATPCDASVSGCGGDLPITGHY